ncbi:hypothetical protein GCM10010275_56020 [Streptomyces litmocidini]|nr:hypothetical protein GCM10010275_56020 [Streptomyces litmocidini]
MMTVPKKFLIPSSSCNGDGATKVLFASSTHASTRSAAHIKRYLPFADPGGSVETVDMAKARALSSALRSADERGRTVEP